MENKNVRRRFSLEDDFMNYKTDDLLFGFMRCLSMAFPIKDQEGRIVEWKEYLPISMYQEEKKTAAQLCGCTSRTIENHLNKLIAAGLVKKGTYVASNGQSCECYFFPYDKDTSFKLLSKDMVKWLVYTRNANAIRIYLYLLNRSGLRKDYNFTLEEIRTALGYAPTSKTANEIIGYVLESFKREGLIDYEQKWFSNGKNKIKKYVLKYIATRSPEDKDNLFALQN